MERIIQPQTAPASGITSISPTWSRRTFWRSEALGESPQPLIYNLGNGAGYSVREVIETAREVTGRPIPVDEVPRRPGDAPAWWPPLTAFAASWAGSPAILPCGISSPVPGNGTAATLMGMINVLYDGWSISHHPDSPAALHLLTLLACCSSGVQPVVALPEAAPPGFRPMRPLTSSRVLILLRDRLRWEQRILPQIASRLGAQLLHLVAPSPPLFGRSIAVVSPAETGQGTGAGAPPVFFDRLRGSASPRRHDPPARPALAGGYPRPH